MREFLVAFMISSTSAGSFDRTGFDVAITNAKESFWRGADDLGIAKVEVSSEGGGIDFSAPSACSFPIFGVISVVPYR